MTIGLSLKNVFKTWNPDSDAPVPAVENVTLDVELGEFVVLLGPSGCGKSSLLYMVAGLEEATGGEIRFDDLPVAKPSPERCLIFQEAALFPWLSVRENVAFGLKINATAPMTREKIVDDLLRQVGLAAMGEKRPNELSGGMRQRAALARALAMRPKVLLMDEPFAALDIQTRALMQSYLLDIWKSSHASVMLVTHSIEEAVALADRIVVFTARPGRIKSEILIDQPRPRDMRSPEMLAVVRRCEDLLIGEVTKAFKEQEVQ